MRDQRFRRARALVAYWEEGEFLIENFLTCNRAAVSSEVVQLLDMLDDFMTQDQIYGAIPSNSKARAVLTELLDLGLVVAEKSSLDERETRLDKTWKWGLDAKYFHYSTQGVEFLSPIAERSALAELAAREEAPSPYKELEGESFELERNWGDSSGDFWDVLRERRTIREFRREPIPLRTFSQVLLWTWGKSREHSDPDLGPYLLKTSPSGGARHPIEGYPLVLRFAGIVPGIYHYSVRTHSLRLLRRGEFEDLAVELCADQNWVRDAAAIFMMTAALDRIMWKYRHGHAYRVLQLDAGHLGQTFHLVCTKLGLAPFTTAACRLRRIEAELEIDGVREVAVYVAAAGIPQSEPRSVRTSDEDGSAI